MQTFTNKFSVAFNQDRSEALINFFQNVPNIPADDSAANGNVQMTSQIIPVANMAMTGQCARNLAEAILKLINAEPLEK